MRITAVRRRRVDLRELSIASVILAVTVFAISCSAKIEDEELDRRIDAAVATALSDAVTPTPETPYEPEAAAYRVARPTESAIFSRFPEYAVLWKASADIGDVPNGQDSFISYVRDMTSSGEPESTLIVDEGLRVFRRLVFAAESRDDLRRWTHPSDSGEVDAICTLFELALRTTLGGITAASIGPRLCGDAVREWEEDQITGADSRTVLERIEAVLDQ